MYCQTPNMIEQEDIEAIELCGIEQGEQPRLYLALRLRPDRTYMPEDGLLLYLTDGVHHRILAPEKYGLPQPLPAKQFKGGKSSITAMEQQVAALQEELKQAEAPSEGSDGKNS